MFEFKTNDFKDFSKFINDNELVIVDFTATWCGPCKKIAPFIEKMCEEHKEIFFIKVDVDKNESICKELGINSMPTFKFYKNGKAFYEFSSSDEAKFSNVLNLLTKK